MKSQEKNPRNSLKSDLCLTDPSKMPRHVAIIMDGNGRWARKNRFARVMGHHKGATTVKNIVTHACSLNLEYLTLYAFSTENWARPKTEVAALMTLLKKFLISQRKLLMEKNVRLNTIGDIQKLPKDVLMVLDQSKTLTQKNTGLVLTLALSYSGRDELTRAFRALGQKLLSGHIQVDDINESTISKALDTQNLPDPDLIIRTSMEFRTSNFLPWQSVYAEYYITDVLWPDFGAKHFDLALKSYAQRERRFGKTAGQVKAS